MLIRVICGELRLLALKLCVLRVLCGERLISLIVPVLFFDVPLLNLNLCKSVRSVVNPDSFIYNVRARVPYISYSFRNALSARYIAACLQNRVSFK